MNKIRLKIFFFVASTLIAGALTSCGGSGYLPEGDTAVPRNMYDYIEEIDIEAGINFHFNSNADLELVNDSLKAMLSEMLVYKFGELNRFADDKLKAQVTNLKVNKYNSGGGQYSHKFIISLAVELTNEYGDFKSSFNAESEAVVLTLNQTDKLAVSGVVPAELYESISNMLLDLIVNVNKFIDKHYDV